MNRSRLSFRRAGLITLLAASVGAAFLLQACSSQPGRTKFRNNNPWTGESEVEYEPSGPATTLPPGWTPGGEQTIDVEIDGKRYRIRICVARRTGSNCIMINTGGCGATEGWQMYCPLSGQAAERGPGPVREDGPRLKVQDSGASMTLHAQAIDIDIDPVPSCPDEWGSADFDEISGWTTLSWVTGCGDEVVPDNLVGDVTITSPSGISLPWTEFSLIFNDTIPAGSRIEISGSKEAAVWNAYTFGRHAVTFESTTGNVVDVMIAPVVGAPPVVVLAVDGTVRHTQFVTRPTQ
jgi:hypothetical protein